MPAFTTQPSKHGAPDRSPPSRRENLRRVMRGDDPVWTPCTINLSQWFDHRVYTNTLPSDLADAKDHIDAMRRLGCDIFSRNFDGGVVESFEGIEPEQITEPGRLGPRSITRFHTPHGILQRITEQQTQFSSSYEVEDLVKDWPRDRKAYLWLLERRRCRWKKERFTKVSGRVGEDGLAMIPLARTPLKQLHIDLGLDYSCMFVMDEPEDAKAICDLFWRTTRPVIEQIADDDAVEVACLMDNVDIPFYPPALCGRYWTPYVRQAADLFASRGKRLFVHACGHLHRLKQTLIDSGVHGLEGMAHPPLGDWAVDDAKSMPAPFIYNGGCTAHEQVTKSDDEVRAFYRAFFEQLDGFPRFIFASACQTAITTPWERIKLVVDLCRDYGGQPA